jgi:formylglycine-generating enzyme required for sulfatase activity
MNCVDTVGNVYEWLDELTYRSDGGTTFDWRNVLGTGKGQAYLQNPYGLISLAAGGNWYGGVLAGARGVSAVYYPWSVVSYYGVRLACDAA